MPLTCSRFSDRRGFTLLELSIVLVIIALIASSIMVGASFIRAAQIRSVLSEYEVNLNAVKEFRDKYNALPGDMINALSIFPSSNIVAGDGNGRIGGGVSAASAPHLHLVPETYYAWAHLGAAGFIDGKYTGTTSGVLPGENVPLSKLDNSSWTIMYYVSSTVGTYNWGDFADHLLMIGSQSPGAELMGSLTSGEAYDIDSKIDDGKPGTGVVRTWRTGVLSLCTTNDSSQSAATYNLTNTGNPLESPVCSLIFKPGF